MGEWGMGRGSGAGRPAQELRARRRFAAVLLASVCASIAAAMPAIAGSPSSPVPEPGAEQRTLDDYLGNLRAFAPKGEPLAKVGDAKAAPVFEEPCFSQTRRDQEDSSAFDVIWHQLSYDCENRSWLLLATTRDAWATSRFEELDFVVNVDGRSTGCNGFDRIMYLYRDPDDANFYGGMVLTPTCDSGDWSAVALSARFMVEGGDGYVGLVMPMSALRGTSSFTWRGALWGTTSAGDFFPSSGAHPAGNWDAMGDGGGFKGSSTAAMGSGYDLVVPGDFNGDGIGDALLSSRGSGAEETRFGKWATGLGAAQLEATGVRYNLAVPGDFNGDGYDDVLFYGRGARADRLRVGSRSGRLRSGPALSIEAVFDMAVPGDFNSDGREDVVFYRDGATSASLRLGNGRGGFLTERSVALPRAFDDVASGGFNRDRFADLLWYASGNTRDVEKLGNAQGTFTAGPAVDIDPVYSDLLAGDFDGNLRADVVFYGRGSRGDALRYSRTTGELRAGPRVDQDCACLPAVGDFNGDGRDDVLWYSAAGRDGVWFGKHQ